MDVTQLIFLLAALATVLDALPDLLRKVVCTVRALLERLRKKREGGSRNKKG